MKSAAFLLFALLSNFSFAAPVPCQPTGPCVYIRAPASPSPAVQIDATAAPGIGLLVQTTRGVATWSGASMPGGVAVWAAAVNGATALNVQGPMLKERTPRNVLKVYNADTGAFVGRFEFEIVQE
jgi:hypothetical protein